MSDDTVGDESGPSVPVRLTRPQDGGGWVVSLVSPGDEPGHLFPDSAGWDVLTARRACAFWFAEQGLRRVSEWDSRPDGLLAVCVHRVADPIEGAEVALDTGRKRLPSQRLVLEHGLDPATAVRLLSLARGDMAKARRLASGETVDAVLGPLMGPLIAYDPRCTGPIPDGLTPFTPFMHCRVSVSPSLARVLADWAPDRGAVSRIHVDRLASGMVHPTRQWSYSPDDRVTVDHRGRVVDGLALLLAVVRAGRVIELDVWHNFPADEWARIEQGRRRPASDVLSVRRLRRPSGESEGSQS